MKSLSLSRTTNPVKVSAHKPKSVGCGGSNPSLDEPHQLPQIGKDRLG